jgi:hypothetical protein
MASMMSMVRRRSGSSYLRTKEPLVCGGPAGQRTQGMATWGNGASRLFSNLLYATKTTPKGPYMSAGGGNQ